MKRFAAIRTWLKQATCTHLFDTSQLELTKIPIPSVPDRSASYKECVAYHQGLPKHPSHTQRVRWPCAKCEKEFFAHTGLDIGGVIGRIAQRA